MQARNWLTQAASAFLEANDFAGGHAHFKLEPAESLSELVSQAIFMFTPAERSEARRKLKQYLTDTTTLSIHDLFDLAEWYKNLHQADLAYAVYQVITEKELSSDDVYKVNFNLGVCAIAVGRPDLATLHFKHISYFRLSYLVALQNCHQAWEMNTYVSCVREFDDSIGLEDYLTGLLTNDYRCFTKIWRDSIYKPAYQILAGISLCKNNQITFDKFMQVYANTYRNFIVATQGIEAVCVYLIATRFIHKTTKDPKYAEIIRDALTYHSPVAQSRLLPFAIPYYLRQGFFEIILDKDYWPQGKLAYKEFSDLEVIQQQYFVLTETNGALSLPLQVEMMTQALCPDTYVGAIIDVQSKPSTQLLSPIKRRFIANLNKHNLAILTLGVLTESTLKAIENLFRSSIETFQAFMKEYPELLYALCNIEYYYRSLVSTELDKEQIHTLQSIVSMARKHFYDKAIPLLDTLLSKSENKLPSVANYLFEKQCYGLAAMVYRKIDGKHLSKTERQQAIYSLCLTNDVGAAKGIAGFANSYSVYYLYYRAFREVYRHAQNEREAVKVQGVHRASADFLDADKITYTREMETATKLSGISEYVLNAMLVYSDFTKEDKKRHLSHVIEVCESLQHDGIKDPEISFYKQQSHYILARLALAEDRFQEAQHHFDQLDSNYNVVRVREGVVKVLVATNNSKGAKIMADSTQPVNEDEKLLKLLAYSHIAVVDKEVEDKVIQAIDAYLLSLDKVTAFGTAILVMICANVSLNHVVKELLTNSSISLDRFFVNELMEYRDDYIDLLLQDAYWPKSLPVFIQQTHLNVYKDSFLYIAKVTDNLDLAIQLLCSNTLIGHFMHVSSNSDLIPRLACVEAILKARLADVREYQQIERVNEATTIVRKVKLMPDISFTTERKLAVLWSDANFKKSLEKFPNCREFCLHSYNKRRAATLFQSRVDAVRLDLEQYNSKTYPL